MNAAAPVNVYLPAKARALCYLVYAVLTASCSAAAAGFLAADQIVPTWLKVTSAVVVSLGTPLGLLAAANTARKEETPTSGAIRHAPKVAEPGLRRPQPASTHAP